MALEPGSGAATVAAWLWPDAARGRALGNLRQRLFRMKRQLGRPVVEAGESLQLSSDLAVDLVTALAALSCDAQACTGELLGDADYSGSGEIDRWVAVARQRWRAARGSALRDEAERRMQARLPDDALPYALRLVQDEPLDENAHRRLMQLHYMRGDRAAALAAYRACEAVLAEELGLVPDAQTQSLRRSIEAFGSSSSEAPSARAWWRRPSSTARAT